MQLPWKHSLFTTEWRKKTKTLHLPSKKTRLPSKISNTLAEPPCAKTDEPVLTHFSLYPTSTNDFIDHNTPQSQSLESQPDQFQIRSTFISDFQNFPIYLPISNSSRYNRQSNAICIILSHSYNRLSPTTMA